MPGVHASWQLSHTNASHRLQDILDALESKDIWNCRTVYDCGVDASVWFDQQVHIEDFEDVMDVLPSVRNMSIQQMYEKQLDANTSITITLAMLKQYQQGGASIGVSGSRYLGKDLQVMFALGLYGRRFSNLVLRIKTRLGEVSFGVNVDGNGSKHSIAWNKMIGEDAAVGVALTQGEDAFDLLLQMNKGTFEGVIGVIERRLSVKKTVAITDDTNALLKVSLKGAQSKVSLGVQRIWSQEASGVMTLQVDVQEGVALKMGLRRRSFDLSIPILLSPDLNPSAMLYGSVLPALIISCINSFVITPFKRWRMARDVVECGERTRRVLEEKKLEAEIATEILGKSNHARTLNSLLKIVKGELRTGNKDSLDVTVQLQYQVHDNQLRIPGKIDWCGMIGMYDIAPGESKQVSIEYVFKDQRHQALFEEGEEVALPQRIHLINQ